jgi:CBS domain containing-hemolysin-like protein
MTLSSSLLTIALLILASAFFSVAEISLAASRRMRLRQMVDKGDTRAAIVLRVQEQPGHYFTVVQIGLNAVAILGGVVGESALSPYFTELFGAVMGVDAAEKTAAVTSFVVVTSLFILFADVMPKRLSMSSPEKLAVAVARPMQFCVSVFKPLVWLYGTTADLLFRLLGLHLQRDDKITSGDILALTEVGAQAGLLAKREQQVIANVFELDTLTVSNAMTPRDRVVWFLRDAPDVIVRARIADQPFSTYPVCDGDIDHVIGYVDAKELFARVLANQPIPLTDPALLHKPLVIPDQLTLAEVLEQFQQTREDFAVIVNEYSMVVGVVTLNDIMSTVMGDLVSPTDEELIVQRDENSWLIDGATPVQEVQRALGIDPLPHPDEYDTLAGFLMVMLRRIPKRTDSVNWDGYKFEVLDVDSYRIDQVMVSRLEPRPPAP